MPRLYIKITRSTATQEAHNAAPDSITETTTLVANYAVHPNSTTPNYNLTDHILDIYQVCDGRYTSTEYSIFRPANPSTDAQGQHLQTVAAYTTVANNRPGTRGFDRNQVQITFDPFAHIDSRNGITTSMAFNILSARTIVYLHRVRH